MTLTAALYAAKAHGCAIRHVDWVPGRTLVVDGDRIIERRPYVYGTGWPEPTLATGMFHDDFTPTYAEAVSDGWEVVK